MCFSKMEMIADKTVLGLQIRSDMERLTKNMPRALKEGRFWIEVKITGPSSEQLSCYSIKGEARALFAPLSPAALSRLMEKEKSA